MRVSVGVDVAVAVGEGVSVGGSGVNVLLGAEVGVLVGLGAAVLQAPSARLVSRQDNMNHLVFRITVTFLNNSVMAIFRWNCR